MHDQVVDAAAGVVEPTGRKVRKLAVALPVGNSVVELVAGRYVKAVNRIWGAKVGEYLSAPDARRHAAPTSGASKLPSPRRCEPEPKDAILRAPRRRSVQI